MVAWSFYEHVFDEPSLWDAVAAWLPADIRTDHLGLWELMLKPKDLAEVKKVLAKVPSRRP